MLKSTEIGSYTVCFTFHKGSGLFAGVHYVLLMLLNELADEGIVDFVPYN